MGILSHIRALTRESGLAAILDQAVSSLGNFLTNILLARFLSPLEYGIFAILFSVSAFLSLIQISLVVCPLLFRGAQVDKRGLQELSTGALAITVILGFLCAPVLVFTAYLLGRPQLAWYAVLALIAWQVQETLRRGLAAHLRFHEAIWGDSLSYLGQAVLIGLFSAVGRLSLEATFSLLAVTSFAAALLQAVQLGIKRVPRHRIYQTFRDFWATGKWMLVANGSSGLIVQSIPWTLAFLRGPAAAGAYQAVLNCLGATHPVILSIGNVILPAASHANAKDGGSAAWRAALQHARQAGLLLLPYLVVLAVWPEMVLSVLYGAGSPYLSLSLPLRIAALAYTFYFTNQALWGLLNAVGRARAAASAQLITVGITFLAAPPLVIWFGIVGACIALALANFLRSLLSLAPALKATSRRVETEFGYP